MITRRAACSCGQLNIETSGQPIRVSVCHCLACQLRTGSAFGVQARFACRDVRVEGRSNQYVRIADSGRNITFQFCPLCGSTVHFQMQDLPDVIGIPVGAFADPQFPLPKFSVYESKRHGWVEVPGQVEHLD